MLVTRWPGKSVITRQQLEYAGLSLEGRGPWPVPTAHVPANLRLEGGSVCYDVMNRAHRTTVVDSTVGMLATFIALESDAAVLDFAQSYGVLGICAHGLPASHNPFPVLPRNLEFGRDACLLVGYPGETREPVARWLHFAAEARALVDIAVALASPGRRWPTKDHAAYLRAWATVLEDEPVSQRAQLADEIARTHGRGRDHLSRHVDLWLKLGDVRPALRWTADADGAALGLGSYDLGRTFGSLAIELATVVSRADALNLCDGCQTHYSPTGRRPQQQRRNYCEACRARRIPARDQRGAGAPAIAERPTRSARSPPARIR